MIRVNRDRNRRVSQRGWSCPVMVVGCGPVGATLALMLARLGVRVLLIEREAGIYPLPRAIAFDSDAFRILQSIGIGRDDFATVAVPRIRLRSPWFGLLADADMRFERDTHPAQSTFHQPDLEDALRRRLRDHPDRIDLRLGTTLLGYEEDEGKLTVRLRGPGGDYAVSPSCVVGCDGANSVMRKAAGIDFRGRSYDDDWLVIDADNPDGGIDHVEFLCDPRRPTPHMPAPMGRQRWEFKLRPGETRAAMERDEAVDRVLAPWGGLAKVRIHRRAVYRFQARSASTYRKGRIMIAGDAAHVTPPFVGQGLISGLRDSHNLAWKLAAVVHGRAPEAILDSYDAERRPHARAMIDFARRIGAIVVPRSRLGGIVVHGLLKGARLLPTARRYLDQLGMRPPARFARGLFRRGSRSGRVRAGEAFPQVWLRDAGGDRVRSDDAFGPWLVCLGYRCDPSVMLDADGRTLAARLGAEIVEIVPAHARCPPAGYRDADDALEGRLAAGSVVLLRPDRVVMCAGTAAGTRAMLLDAERMMRDGTAETRG